METLLKIILETLIRTVSTELIKVVLDKVKITLIGKNKSDSDK